MSPQRGSVLSWIGLVSCFFVIDLTLQHLGLGVSLGLGPLATVATTMLVLWVDRRSVANQIATRVDK